MRHAKKVAAALAITTLLYNNCSGFKAVDTGSGFSSSASLGTEAPLLGVDPHPDQYPPSMGTPAPRNPETLTPVTTWPAKQAEFALVPSNFNVSDWVGDDGEDTRPAWNQFDDVGAFRFICKPSHNLYDDPIVYPGQPGASHLHTFFGNTSTTANSTYQSLRANGDGTCSGGPLNRSAYWFPALRIDGGQATDANDQVVMPDFAAVYYKMPPLSAALFPRGLRIIFGYNMSNPAATDTDMRWQCNGPNNGPMRGTQSGSLTDLAAQNVCQPGDDLEVTITAPTCWNGQLDSPDHRSHIVNVQDTHLGYTACPADHPYHFPAFHLGIHFSLGPTGNAELQKMYVSSDHMSGMRMTPGSTFHTDWFGAWDDNVATEWMGHADAGFKNCSGGDLCDGRGMADPFTKTGMFGYNSLLNMANPRVVSPPVHP